MDLTWLDSNSWLIELAGQRILLDPWLVGPLTFGNLPWLFKGDRPQPRPIPADIDLILLSQGLEDHTHPPTLKQLDPSIPVVGSPSAAKIVTELGFTQVTALAHGQTFRFNHQVEIRATPGSPIGPQAIENGYLLTEVATGTKLYYEPHGYHSPELKALAPVDVIVTPLIDLDLWIAPFIKGGQAALDVARWLQPQVMISTAAGGDVNFSGLLINLIKIRSTVDDFRQLLAEQNLPIQVLDPQPGDRFQVPLVTQVSG